MNFKRTSALFAAVMLVFALCCLPAYAVNEGLPKVIDDADLFTPEEELELSNRIQQINGKYNFEVVILTTNYMNGKDIVAYADDFYDQNGYGEDGIIFVVDMGTRQYYTSTCGYGTKAFTDYGISQLNSKIGARLSEGDYIGASRQYVNTAISYLDQAKSGKPYDVETTKKKKGFGHYALGTTICSAISAAFSGLITGAKKSEMNNVQQNNRAENYIVNGSVNIANSEDMFLYHNVTRNRIQLPGGNMSGGSGGSTIHTSSSGRSHGGGGGRF